MTTAQRVLEIARSQIGYSEYPHNSNRTKYGEWYGMNGEPWCDMFVSWVGDKAGGSGVIGKFAYCPYHVNWFKKNGRWIGRNETPKPGDVIFFANKGVACHVGFVESVSGNVVSTIEGNTATGNNDNGGKVMKRTRTLGTEGSSWYILGYGRPDYENSSISFPINIKEGRMNCIIQPNGEGRLVFYDGVNLHSLTHPDQVEAIQKVARMTLGKDIPVFVLGSKEAPWATRFFEAVSAGA